MLFPSPEGPFSNKNSRVSSGRQSIPRATMRSGARDGPRASLTAHTISVVPSLAASTVTAALYPFTVSSQRATI